MNNQDNVVFLKQWKQRNEIINQLNQFGWEAKGIDLIENDDPFFFYITEPLDTQFMAMGCARTEDLIELVNGGISQYGTPAEISDVAGTISLGMIDGVLPKDQETLELLILSHMINFATTKTAKFALEHTEKFLDNLTRPKGRGFLLRAPDAPGGECS